jgi:hypothetical protein
MYYFFYYRLSSLCFSVLKGHNKNKFNQKFYVIAIKNLVIYQLNRRCLR